MPTVVAQDGDSLCGLAHAHGLGDCTPLRTEAANAALMNRADLEGELVAGDVVTIPELQAREEDGATEQQHTFQVRARLASIRFVHGSPTLPFRQDPTIPILNVSNYIANRAGAPDGSQPFPPEGVRRFDPDGEQDIDTFKVEVEDIRAAGTLKVDLEVLRPIYVGGIAVRHEKFPAAIAAARKLNQIDAVIQGSSRCFRTSYLKLVSDEQDVAAAPNQVLLAMDMHDAGDSQVEILDQVVKASYIMTSCPGNPQCKVTTTAPIGTDRRRIRLAVHVLNTAVGGAPVVPTADVERRIFTWFRRGYAQMSISPKLMGSAQVIDPPENLVAIADGGAGAFAVANGTEVLSFRINATGIPSQVIGPFTPAANGTPETTARALAALVQAPFQATVSENAARLDALTDNDKSFDIVIKETGGAHVTIDQEAGPAIGHTLTVGRVLPANVPRANFQPTGLIGSIQQRALFKNFDTGDDRVDVFVCVNIIPAGVLGTATISGHRVNNNRAAVPMTRRSVLMTVATVDSSNTFPFVFPHEFGHVAGETGHAQAADQQLMTRFTTAANAIDGPKRVRAAAVTYDLVPGNFNLIDRIRAESAGLLENW